MDMPATQTELRILLLEDEPTDAELAEDALREAGLPFVSRRVDTREMFVQALEEFKPDIVLADYKLPSFDGGSAVKIVRQQYPTIPVVMLTGAMGDEKAVELLGLGAKDYVLKDRLARLAPAVKRALSEEMGIRRRKLAEGKYRALFAEAMDGILLIDCETWQIEDCNPEFEKQSGRMLEQLKQLKVWEVLPPEQHEPARQSLLEIQNTGVGRGSIFTIQKPDGEIVPFEFSAKFVSIQQQSFIQCITRDISERLRAERALTESEMRYRRLFEAAKDGILILDAESGKIVDANPFILSLLSYSRNECIGKMLWEIGVFADAEASKLAFQELQAKGYIRYEDMPLKAKGGRLIEVEFISNTYDIDGRKVIQCNIRDISERLRAERALHDSEEKFRTITASAQDAILMMDSEGKISYWNAAAEKIFGYTSQEAIWQTLHTLLVPERFLEAHRKGFSHFQKTGEGHMIGKTIELAALRKNGSEFPIELSLSAIMRDGQWHSIGIIRDITERKQTEKTLRETTYALGERLKELRCLYAITKIGANTELPLEQSLQHIVETVPPAFQYPEITCARIKQQGRLYVSHGFKETPWRLARAIAVESGRERGELEVFYLEERPLSDEGPFLKEEVTLVNTIAQTLGDLWQRYLDDMALNRAHRALKTLSAGNLALVRSANEDALLQTVTKAIVEMGGYRMATVAYADDNPEKSITPMALSGMEEGQYWIQYHSWADTKQGQTPIAIAIRSGTTQICHDIAGDPGFKPWRDAALTQGYVSNIAMPLSGGGRIFGGLSIYSSEADAFDEEEVRLLEELASDLAYGIIALRTRVAHEQHATILRQSLEQSIQTIADTVEARDPYTAGHQRRVSELAIAIAREMGLPEEQIHGIHLAAIIHDLGKIHIPAEILSKPGKLSDIEYMLIKTHPQAGYDILKGVKFPWPISNIILQHHERLDGSGYPFGLKGEQLLLESKIVAVADVVEAMSTHRPYRPTLGILAALGEIERGRGSAYDPAVVDICLKLFNEKQFAFSQSS